MTSKLVKASPLYLQAYNQLKGDIISNVLKPGERLTDQQLADWLGISRTPVREAARILCREGLLNSENGVITVYKPNLTDICQVYLLRASTESLAISIIASKPDRHKLTSVMEKIVIDSHTKDKDNISKLQELNTKFHDFIVSNSGLALLEEVCITLNAKMQIFRNISLNKNRNREISIEEHQKITELVVAGDVLNSKHLMERHILSAGKRAINNFQESEKVEDKEIYFAEQVKKYISAHLEIE